MDHLQIPRSFAGKLTLILIDGRKGKSGTSKRPRKGRKVYLDGARVEESPSIRKHIGRDL